MPKFKIKTSAKHKFGQTNQVPYAGKISFDNEGNSEVDVRDELELQKLFEAVSDLSTNIPVVETFKHVVTEQDITNNPELLSVDIKAGDVIGIPIDPQVQINDIGISGDAGNDIGEHSDDANETSEELKAALASPLDAMNIQELRNLAKESGFPDSEWKDFTKVPLRAYLKGKLDLLSAV